MPELLMPNLQSHNRLFQTEYRGVSYEYYLTGEIGDPEEYNELCNLLRSANENDEIIIRINSIGGQCRSGVQIINAIEESAATVIGYIEGDCMSMATFVFLACSGFGVSKWAEFMAHTTSSGSWGKEHETYEQAAFLRKQTHKRIREGYKYFMTDDEIERIVAGQDVYLDADEIEARLPYYIEQRQADREAKQKEAYERYVESGGCGQEGCEECLPKEEQFAEESELTQAEIDALLAEPKDVAPKKSRKKT